MFFIIWIWALAPARERKATIEIVFARRRKRDDVSARRRPAVQNFAPALREILDENDVLVLVCVYGLFLPELAETAALAALQS